jgi:hypothetical protein
MLKYMATYNKICRFINVLRRVIVGNEANISGNVIVGFGLIARTETNTDIIPTIAYNPQEIAFSTSNFDNIFVVQAVSRNQLV